MSDLAPDAKGRGRPDETGQGYAVTPELVRDVSVALKHDRPDEARALVANLHAADLADLIEALAPDRRDSLVDAIGRDLDPAVLAEFEEQVRDDVIEHLAPEDLAAHAAELDTDDAAHVLEDLEAVERRRVLEAMPVADRELVEAALAYPEDSAGRIMQRDYVAVPAYWTIGDVIDWLREGDNVPDEFYEIFVVDPRHVPIGTVPLNRAMRAKRPVQVSEIMNAELRTIPVEMDQEEVAFVFDQYDLMSAPVIDGDGRLIGQITVDDVVDVIQDEHEEDLLRLGGVTAEGDLFRPAAETASTRFTWLLVNLFTAILASITIAFFIDTIKQIVALAVLMPIVASMGGNAGTQTLTVTVRAIATRELTMANATRIFWKETMVGGYNGLAFALLAGIVAGLWFDSAMLGVVIGLAMIVNMLVAGVSGMAVPFLLWRAGIDPAISAVVLLTTITDVIGFFAFLGLASLILL